jgi:hypothetical protein
MIMNKRIIVILLVCIAILLCGCAGYPTGNQNPLSAGNIEDASIKPNTDVIPLDTNTSDIDKENQSLLGRLEKNECNTENVSPATCLEENESLRNELRNNVILISSDASDADTSDTNEFEMFIETWSLSGLISEGLSMTSENRNDVLMYFQKFDDITRNYLILLLQSISAGETTVTDPYNDYIHGVYLRNCQYCLYDMNLDGFPELILKTGGCEADYWYTIYTITDDRLVDCGGISGGHAVLYTNGTGGFVQYAGHMGAFNITESALDCITLVTKEIAGGEIDFSKGTDYPELKEYGYADYGQCLEFSDIPTLMLCPAG